MASDPAVPLLSLTENKTDEDDIFFTKPYLKKFIKSKSIIGIKKWEGNDEDYAELNDVLGNYKMDKLKRMLLGGAPYLYKKDDNNYAMTHTAFYSRTDIMEIILERHRNEKTPDDEDEFQHQTCLALYTICSTNCGDIACALLNVDTPVIPQAHLNEAAATGSTAVLNEILTFFPRMDVNPKDSNGNTPLHKAVENKHTHTVQYLLNKNANPNAVNNDGYNTVHMACQYADESVLYLLTTRNADVNARENIGKSPALIAAENGKEGCIHILAAAGANLDQRDKQGDAPLIVAASLGHTNTVKELILNGASFDVTDNERYNALERAIHNKKDGAAAMFIRLSPQNDYVEYYLNTIEISLFKIVRYQLKETIKALLDRMVVQEDPLNATKGTVQTKYLDIDTAGKMPDNENEYEKNTTFLLQRIAGLDDEDLAYHGTIRLLVDKKMKQFGNRVLGIKIFFYILFLLALAYSLIILAAFRPIDLNEYTNGALNIIRILAELFVLVYFVFNLVTEGVEFFRVTRLTIRYIKDKKKDRKKELLRAETVEEEDISKNGDDDDDDDDDDDVIGPPAASPAKAMKKRSITSRLNDLICIRIFTDYFSDKSNYLDVLGLLTLFILILLRLSTQPTQWVFATLTFLINGFRLFKLVALLPRIGPYTNIIYKILVNDVPLFSSLFLITLLIFTGGYFVSLRTPYTAAGFANASLMENTERTRGVDNEVQWVFLSGLRVLLEGNVYEGQYLFRQLNWLAASLYLGFLFLTVVVYLNVFIAQLSDTYGIVKQNAEKTFAWQRMNFIVQVERTSLLSICIDYRKKYFTKKIEIEKEELFEHYGVYSIKNMNVKSFTEDVEVKGMLSSIQNQQVVARRTQEIAKLNTTGGDASCLSPPPQQQPQAQEQPQKQEYEEIRELRETIDQLMTEIRQKDVLLDEKLEKSNRALLEKIEEKLKDLK
ncbi:Ankyrin repeat domain-containing 29-like [Oopsacas minuta]|uniref:Ankyrin repeat domain-containing 29-like n=1 Tax=Oopsacas minuta TaxID=111878 RepID=A0AAV7JYR4_9METZ|nr:Ankyrin repeat domain-containing 29-like [Oopsacas minuta]